MSVMGQVGFRAWAMRGFGDLEGVDVGFRAEGCFCIWFWGLTHRENWQLALGLGSNSFPLPWARWGLSGGVSVAQALLVVLLLPCALLLAAAAAAFVADATYLAERNQC